MKAEQIDQLVAKEQIQGMKAGRELDALVVEKVFNKSITTTYGEDSVHTLDRLKVGYLIQNYSTDIAAAWEVVEKLKEKGISIYVKAFLDTYCVEAHSVGSSINKILADTAPEAICKAALLAILEVE